LAVQPPDPRVVAAATPYATNADPQLRASALRALDLHDPAGRSKWHAMGLADAHPYVRMETFAMIKEVESLSTADIEKDVDDVIAYMSPPNDGLVHLITVRHKRGELREALALVDVLQRVALPRERRAMNLDGVRARIEADLAKKR
jgi:hypothetical protein